MGNYPADSYIDFYHLMENLLHLIPAQMATVAVKGSLL